MDDFEAPEKELPSKNFPNFSYKRVGVVFFIIVVLLISNELVFRWEKQRGISEFDNNNFPERTFAMAFDSKDNLWIAGAENTSNHIDTWRYYVTELRPDGNIKTYKISGGDQYLSLAVDSFDQVWIGGKFGLRKLTQQGEWISVSDQIIAGKRVGSLANDDQGQLWVITEGGQLSRLSDGKWTHFPGESAKIVSAQQEQIWGKKSGTIGFFSTTGNWNDEFSFEEVYSFAIDKDGRVWAKVRDSSSYHGLAVCDSSTKKCSIYHENNSGVFPLSIVMTFDNQNRLWAGSRILDVERMFPANILNGLLIFRVVSGVLLFLSITFVIVRVSDTRRWKKTPEYLTKGDVLKKVWPVLFLIGLAGPVLLSFTGVFYLYKDTHVLILFAIAVLVGASVTFIRARSSMAPHSVSKADLIECTVFGGLITLVSTIPVFLVLLLLRSFGQ